MKELLPILTDYHAKGEPIIIAGPCSAETEEQTLETARRLAGRGIRIFRAGIWKPRTKPGVFEGIGAPALKWLARVKKETGMAVACEVATRAHVKAALRAGVDILWIGARTSANPFAVQEIADTISETDRDVTVLVKNPVSPDPELWIGALQRLYEAGVRHLGAIHRGFPAYGPHIYRNMPQWRIPTELRLRFPDLPILVDPSHIGGKREFVGPLSQEALDMGFDGLIIESHCAPDEAWSDAAQQLTPEALDEMLKSLVHRKQKEVTGPLSIWRGQIDTVDTEMLELLARRMEISGKIGEYKREHEIPVLQPDRYNDVIATRLQQGESLGLDKKFLRNILLMIHDESVRQQLPGKE